VERDLDVQLADVHQESDEKPEQNGLIEMLFPAHVSPPVGRNADPVPEPRSFTYR
jgi:hypothetical protein